MRTKLTILALATAITLMGAGCERMPNDQIIAEVKKCVDAGLEAVAITNIDGIVHGIECYPKSNQSKE